MASKYVEKYRIAWGHDGKYGVVQLHFQGGGAQQIQPLAYEDFTAIVDILRNEKPVFYDANSKLLGTFHEPVGEGEN